MRFMSRLRRVPTVWWLLLVAALGIASLAARTIDSRPLDALVELLAIAVVLLFGWWARWELRRSGARPWVVSAVLVVVACLIGISVLRLVWLVAPPASAPYRMVEIVDAVLFITLTVAWMAPTWVVRLLGGPRPEWSVLRERATIWLDIEQMGVGEATERDVEIRARVRAMDRFRSPATAEYIDTYQMMMLSDQPAEVKDLEGARFVELEAHLHRSLGARPTWGDEVEQRLRAISEPMSQSLALAAQPDPTSSRRIE